VISAWLISIRGATRRRVVLFLPISLIVASDHSRMVSSRN